MEVRPDEPAMPLTTTTEPATTEPTAEPTTDPTTTAAAAGARPRVWPVVIAVVAVGVLQLGVSVPIGLVALLLQGGAGGPAAIKGAFASPAVLAGLFWAT